MKTKQILLAAVASVFAGTVFAQAPAATAPRGLDAVDDSIVLDELGRLGLEQLMDRYFQTHSVPAEQQAAVRAMISIRRMLEPKSDIPARQKQEMVRRITAGASSIVPTLKDPRQLMQLSTVLIKEGMERNANAMEYWGETPRSQAEIRPVAEVVASVLDRCAAAARELATKLEARFGNVPPKALVDQWQELDSLAQTAKYSRYMADYYRVLSIDKADPRRKTVADEAITGLQEYDNADSGVQSVVRLRIGKLQMAKGAFADAKKSLGSIIKPPEDMKPAPTVFQQYDARYFTVVCDLLAGDLATTKTGIADLGIWEEANLPKEKSVQDGARAALAMLQYRHAAAEAEKASDAAGKTAASERATAVLRKLAEERPELRGIIYEQLVKTLRDDAPMAEMETLMLQAILQRGMGELNKGPDEKTDPKTMERAIAAASELLARKDRAGVDKSLVDAAGIILPQLYEKDGKDIPAAKAYLDYVATADEKSTSRAGAMNNAIAALNRIRTANPSDSDADRLMGQALSLAVDKLHQNTLAYDYGRRLQRDRKWAEAAKAYRLVPAGDNRAPLAKFFLMMCVKEQMDTTADKTQKALLSQETQKLCAEVTALAKAGLASASNDAEKTRYRLMDARARLTTAALARESDPAKALQTLLGIEKVVDGLAGEDDLMAEALFYRVNSMMALGRNAEATSTLLELLKAKGGNEGAQIIFGLLKKLDGDLENARKASDTDTIAKLLKARADLSGPLVQWAQTNPDPKIQQYTYRYMVFDAATKQQAAMAEKDVEKRVARLNEAMGLFKGLLSNENIKRWQETVDRSKFAPDDLKKYLSYGDTTVLHSIALLEFELANYKEARSRLGRLLEDRKLGTPRIPVTQGGETILEDNPQYWEATYKLYRSNTELAKSPTTPDAAALLNETKSGLKMLYIREGEDVGGQQWKDEFESLRKELIPDFVVSPATAAAPGK